MEQSSHSIIKNLWAKRLFKWFLVSQKIQWSWVWHHSKPFQLWLAGLLFCFCKINKSLKDENMIIFHDITVNHNITEFVRGNKMNPWCLRNCRTWPHNIFQCSVLNYGTNFIICQKYTFPKVREIRLVTHFLKYLPCYVFQAGPKLGSPASISKVLGPRSMPLFPV